MKTILKESALFSLYYAIGHTNIIMASNQSKDSLHSSEEDHQAHFWPEPPLELPPYLHRKKKSKNPIGLYPEKLFYSLETNYLLKSNELVATVLLKILLKLYCWKKARISQRQLLSAI